MNKYIKNLLALIIVMIIFTDIQAQQLKPVQPIFRGQVIFEGGKLSGNDSLSIQFLKPYQPIGVPVTRPAGKDGFYLVTDKNGRFEFKLPAFDEPIHMSIGMKSFTGYEQGSPDIVSSFVEKDDDITVTIVKTGKHGKDYATFSGKGFEKYETAILLQKLSGRSFASGEYLDRLKLIARPKGVDTSSNVGKIIQFCRMTDTLLKKKADIIVRSGMSMKMKKLYAYNFGRIYDHWVFEMYGHYRRYKNDHTISKTVKEVFAKYSQQFSYPQDTLMALAPLYRVFAAANDFYALTMKSDSKEIEFQDVYHLFKSKYSGKFRELLIADFFIKGFGWKGTSPLSQRLVDSLMKDGAQFINTPIIKDAYTTRLKLAGGTDVYNGKFKDINGKELSLNSLKGKTIFLDLWFTGCGACARFHQAFHEEGFPSLKDNTDFVYVSVSIDKQKEKWLKSINSGLLTSKDYLNLNAELGVDDPFLKYYNRNALPFIILVDKNGKIYACDMIPEPKAVVSLINEALAVPLAKSK